MTIESETKNKLGVKITLIPYEEVPQVSSRDKAYAREDSCLRPFYKYPTEYASFEDKSLLTMETIDSMKTTNTKATKSIGKRDKKDITVTTHAQHNNESKNRNTTIPSGSEEVPISQHWDRGIDASYKKGEGNDTPNLNLVEADNAESTIISFPIKKSNVTGDGFVDTTGSKLAISLTGDVHGSSTQILVQDRSTLFTEAMLITEYTAGEKQMKLRQICTGRK